MNPLPADVLARVEVLDLQVRGLVDGLRVGGHRSPYRGFSVDFVEHRPYAPGDSTRHLDWKVLARSERYTVRQYELETDLTAHLVLDASRSMTYGDGAANKLAYARLLAGCLAFVILRQRDRLSLTVAEGAAVEPLPPGADWPAVCRALAAAGPGGGTPLRHALAELAARERRRGVCLVFTDALDDELGLLEGLKRLRHAGHEVVLVHVLHPDEREFPFDGLVRFDVLEEGEPTLTRPQDVRDDYRQALDQFLRLIQAGCAACGGRYVFADTGRPAADLLGEFLAGG
jgi:uncharacterized protein (DUF58 family)